MTRMVKGLYVSPDCVKVCEVDDDRGCDGYYELLGCDTIEAPEAMFRVLEPGTAAPEQDEFAYFDIICDEEAKCKGGNPECTVAWLHKDGTADAWIFGPCFVCKATEDGDWCSPTDEELRWLKTAVRTYKGNFILTVEARA